MIRPSIMQCRSNWALFFVMVIYLEKTQDLQIQKKGLRKFYMKTMATRRAMRTGVRWTTASSQVKLERHVQHAAHRAQHQWRRWRTELRRSRGARALRLHASLFTVSDDCLTHISWLKFWAHSQSSSFHPWRTLLDSPLHFPLLPLPPVCPRLPLPPRAVPWAPLHEGHGKPALLRCRRVRTPLNVFHPHTPREDDGAIEFWRLQDYLRNHFEQSQQWSDKMW